MEKHYSQLIIFYYVVEFMSITKAAQHLNCSKAHISKQLTALERQVGSSLIHRNTRSLTLTFAGETIYSRASALVHELDLAKNTIYALQNKAEGLLRITSPRGYADCFLAPHLPRFLEEHPDIRLEMKHCGEFLDLLKEKIDVAIRITHEPPLDKVAKYLGTDRMVLCASPKYLESQEILSTPQQLQTHQTLVYFAQTSSVNWAFYHHNLFNVKINPRISSNSAEIILKAAINGLGIARLPLFIVNQAITDGHLSLVLEAYYPPDIPIYAVYAQSRLIPPKVQVFIQFLERLHAG